MLSVNSLRKSILKIDPEAELQGLDKKGLSGLLEDLRGSSPSDDSDGLDDLDLDDELSADDDEPIASKSVGHIVAMGKAITTKRGVRSDGDVISSSDLASKESFDKFIQKGFIVADGE